MTDQNIGKNYLKSMDPTTLLCFHESIISNAHVWLMFLAPDSSVVIWNREAEKISGYSESEVVGSNQIWKALYPEKDYRRSVFEMFRKGVADSGCLENARTTVRSRNGSNYVISWNTRSLMDNKGNIIGYIAIGKDITEHLKAEEENLLLSEIVNSSRDAIVGMDLDGEIITWNPGAETIYGYSADEILGKSIDLVIPDDRKEEMAFERMRISNNEKIHSFQTARTTKSGEKKYISLSVSPIVDTNGNITGASSIGRDITREKELERTMVSYISEAAMRLKNPVEIVRDNLTAVTHQISDLDADTDEIILTLQVQVRATEQILHNLRELNQAIIGSFEEMPANYKDFLSR